ncbi:MAG: hypothetical protein COA33_014255 [Fluviicola sp.]|nr:hypothetical protein [Fluviicola sp.]
MQKSFILLFIVSLFCQCSENRDIIAENIEPSIKSQKINGVSFEMPSVPVSKESIGGVKRVNADWVAFIPYGHTLQGKAEVIYSENKKWWGESIGGVVECIEMAKEHDLKTMMKPHVWVIGQGWPGDFDLSSEEDWIIWENSYEKYILTFAKLSDSMEVDLFCIGTEYRKAVVKRPQFWENLIKKVRKVYHGKITYAANWDNYEKVGFWDEVDFIGIDAYFPLSTKARPQLEELKQAWGVVEKKLKKLSKKHDAKILFTEYGYKSIEYSNSGFWKYDEDTVLTNQNNQNTAYEALFESVWQNDWMAGGFFWKWRLHRMGGGEIGGEENRRYTPQGKITEQIIKKWYGQEEIISPKSN